jgi:hypothetical protein
MYIDTSHITRGGKTYTRHLLRESFRANGKVLHRTIANQRSDKKLGIIKVLPFQFSQQHGAFFL